MSIILLMVPCRILHLHIHHSVLVSRKTCIKHNERAVVKVFINTIRGDKLP